MASRALFFALGMNPVGSPRVDIGMTTPLSTQRRSEDFDELLWQIHGELATPAPSASLAAAPFIDLEPEPDPEYAEAARSLPSSPVAHPHSKPDIRH